MKRWAILGCLLLFALVILSFGASGGGAPTEESPSTLVTTDGEPSTGDSTAYVTSTAEFDSTIYTITVHEDGSATWTFRHERILSDTEDEESFESYAAEFEAEELELYDDFVASAEGLVELGQQETDREMEATDFNRTATVEQRFNTRGVVEMSFVWSNFAETAENEVVVGDVFDGSFFIASDQTLVIEAEDGLVFDSVQPEGELSGQSLEESSSVTWAGREQFHDGQPRVVMLVEGADETGIASENGGGSNGLSGTQAAAGVGVLALLFAAVIGAYRYGVFSRTSTGSGQHAQNARGPSSSETSHQPPTITDEELLSDEDRVISLISENGGRMKQVDIVDETGWSKSKVSMLLSDMEAENTISKLRVGRENIISLEGHEPEAAKSPFDE